MALDFNLPVTSDERGDVLSTLRAHVTALSKMLDGETVSNVPTGAIRYSTSNTRFERWNGSAWAALSLSFVPTSALSGTLTGNVAAFASLTVGGSAVWHAGNFDPATKQNAATAWNTGNFDPSTKQNVATAWHTGNFNPSAYQLLSGSWNTSNFDPNSKQNVLGFTPVNKAGDAGIGALGCSRVYVGYDSGSGFSTNSWYYVQGETGLYRANGWHLQFHNLYGLYTNVGIMSAGKLWGNGGGNGLGAIHVSGAGPSGGTDGDLWLQV